MSIKKYAVYGTTTITVKKIIKVDASKDLDESDIIRIAEDEFEGLTEFADGSVGAYDDDVELSADCGVEFECCEEEECTEDDYNDYYDEED